MAEQLPCIIWVMLLGAGQYTSLEETVPHNAINVSSSAQPVVTNTPKNCLGIELYTAIIYNRDLWHLED